MVINLFIPAAGLGTRLYPLTADKPKALVEVNGKPMIQHILDKFVENNTFQINKIIVNVHHFAEQLIEYLQNYEKYDIVISDEREMLLDTGGGLKQVLEILNDEKPLLVHNTDIETNFDFKNLFDIEFDDSILSTLVVSERETSRYLLFNDELELCGWKNIKTNESIIVNNKVEIAHNYAFSGIQLVNPQILDFLPDKKVFPLIPEYLSLAKNHTFKAYPANNYYFNDLGKNNLK
ncbi:MAG: NTP transferase domain-containing protein [Bacteroidales bacterium]|jgi:NDP-sugar pyrophosphorylase family protein|nr:NTP transferase domain-containing protein [Bacteroidales bacterium]